MPKVDSIGFGFCLWDAGHIFTRALTTQHCTTLYWHNILFIRIIAGCLQVLQQAVGCHDAAVLVQVLRSARPDTHQQDKVETREWSRACLVAVLPGAVRLLHKLLAPSQAAQLSADQLQVTVCFSIHALGRALMLHRQFYSILYAA